MKKWKQRLLAGIIIFAAVSTTYALFKHQFDILPGYIYLYFKNDPSVRFNSVNLVVPYYYVRTQSEDQLPLLHYPTRAGLIMASLGKHQSRIEFIKKHETFIPQAGLKRVKEELINVGGVEGHLIEAMDKTDPNDFRIYVGVPEKNFFVEYMGNEKEKETFFSVINSVSFKN